MSTTKETPPVSPVAENISAFDASDKHATAKAVNNLSFEQALGTANRPHPFGRGHVQLYFMCLLVYLCSTMGGYDGSLMGSVYAMDVFKNYYGVNGKDTGTGIVFSIFQASIGQMAGGCFIWIADWRGRRLAIFVGTVGTVIGTIIVSTAPTVGALIAGRFILSTLSTIAASAAALYLTEIAPPLYRGTVAGMFNTLYYCGSMIATFCTYGTYLHFPDSTLAFRIPFWMQAVCPGIVTLFIWFLPESPRWLIANGRSDEARAFLAKHHANGDPNHPIVALEMDEMTESLKTVNLSSPREFFDLRVFFNTRARRYRTFLLVCMSWFGQFSGNNVASYYLPTMLETVGITSTSTQLLMNAIYAITGWIAAGSGARFHDIFGRRKMLLGSTIGMVICFAIITGTTAEFLKTGNHAASSASIAWIYIFGVTFAFAYTSMQPIYPAEVMDNQMRAKGMGLFQIVAGCAGFVNTFAAPVAMANITFWFYFFFVVWDIFEALIIYFFFVETKGRTLEEMEEVFNAPDPRKASTQKIIITETVVESEDDQKVHAEIVHNELA